MPVSKLNIEQQILALHFFSLQKLTHCEKQTVLCEKLLRKFHLRQLRLQGSRAMFTHINALQCRLLHAFHSLDLSWDLCLYGPEFSSLICATVVLWSQTRVWLKRTKQGWQTQMFGNRGRPKPWQTICFVTSTAKVYIQLATLKKEKHKCGYCVVTMLYK